ncbi:MAG: ferritin-like domain-containing protein [Acidimicrobiales bacterium]
MTYDEAGLRELTEQSQDLQSDSLSVTKEALDEFVDGAHEKRDETEPTEAANSERGVRKAMVGALIAGGFGAAVAGLIDASAAAAATSSDVMILQTAASIEVLAVATYGKALTLPFIGGSSANPVVKAFAQTTKGQHSDHLAAFNAAVTQLGGKKQTKPDPKYAPIVQSAVPTLTTPAKVVALARTLELVAAETYVANSTELQSTSARKVMASIMGVEAQHVAVLDAVAALLAANAPQLISLAPGNAAKLPAVAGKVGIPYVFYPTSEASKPSEGAVK